ncbi:hypothetical protein ACHAXR_005751 [Thalassiosira sp. AJA248-18]
MAAEAAECGTQAGGQLCPGVDECCSQFGWCDVGESWCGEGCQSGQCYPTEAPTARPTPSMIQPSDTAKARYGDSRLIAYVGNWQECPTTAQTDAYTHIIVAFAVTYTYDPLKNKCDEQCNIITESEDGLTVCDYSVAQELVNSWRDAGKKVILSFGGAGMGGSWSGDRNNCWDYCFGKEDEVATALVSIVQRQNFDGIDIDYEYCYDAMSGRKWTEDAKAQNFLSTITTLLREKLDVLGTGYELTHAPMDPDLVQDSPYYQILKEQSSNLDFIMPQFYNGYTQPAADGFDGSIRGPTKTSTIYGDLVNDMFGGQPEKVVFGFCIGVCSGSQVKAYNDGEFSCNGGAFFWVAFLDTGGTWSDPVWEELQSTSGCSVSDDDFEVVFIKFEVKGLPDGEAEAIKAEMTTILNRILLRIEGMIPGMIVYSVEENKSVNDNLVRGVDATMYYNMNILRDDYKDFNTAIIQELRDSYNDILYTM